MTGRELDGYWKTVVNTLRDGIMIVNTRGAIVSVNQAFEHITGYSGKNSSAGPAKSCIAKPATMQSTAMMAIGAHCIAPALQSSGSAGSDARTARQSTP